MATAEIRTYLQFRQMYLRQPDKWWDHHWIKTEPETPPHILLDPYRKFRCLKKSSTITIYHKKPKTPQDKTRRLDICLQDNQAIITNTITLLETALDEIIQQHPRFSKLQNIDSPTRQPIKNITHVRRFISNDTTTTEIFAYSTKGNPKLHICTPYTVHGIRTAKQFLQDRSELHQTRMPKPKATATVLPTTTIPTPPDQRQNPPVVPPIIIQPISDEEELAQAEASLLVTLAQFQ